MDEIMIAESDIDDKIVIYVTLNIEIPSKIRGSLFYFQIFVVINLSLIIY
jgi:hypothetical protein